MSGQPYISPTARQWLTIGFLPGIGPVTLTRLAERYGSAAAILAASGDPSCPSRLARVLSDRILLERAGKQADILLARLPARQISLVCRDDPCFPDRLLSIADVPACLYCHGDLSLLERPAVAIVGARSASEYGLRISRNIASELAREGIVVVSGVAYGIDARAHEGALGVGGLTCGVLGCGVDVVYPRKHASLYEEIRAKGVLVSEYPPGTRPEGFRFPARNRIISGLSLGVVVVEATMKSGSLITARLALDQGREVFAVPGRVDSARSRGPHWLLRQGAWLVESGADVVRELGLQSSGSGSCADERSETASLTADQAMVFDTLDVYPVDIDTLRQQTGLEAGRLLEILLHLELAGKVRQLPGQMYERCENG